MKKEKIGAVLVVGGGIGGIQASLDLADSGFKVYLVEKSPSIGGVMAQLDKTFPTNDCSMCILAPKLVGVARHPNIEIITNADVDKLSGEAGNYVVTIRERARYIDEDKCTGCGDCAGVCPVQLPSEFDECLSLRNAIYRPYPQAVPNAFKIDKIGVPPCKDACPAGLSAQAYAAFIAEGKFKEALDYIRGVMPFPSICGRVCHHPCEEDCNRKDLDEVVSIMRLKRFVADWVREKGDEPVKKVEIKSKDKIAVIGAGPAGLTCAEKLIKKGYPVTIFDSSDTPGGMMTSCIPEYRLPCEIALYDTKRLLDLGIEFRHGTVLGKDITLEDLQNNGFKAIFIAIGAQNAKKLNIEGVGNRGILYGIPFLRSAKAKKNIANLGERIIVIGGGNVAIDCARTALRLGAKEVHLVCLETRDLTSKDRMPAHEWEILEAEEEGIIIHPAFGPNRIMAKNGTIIGLEIIECVSVYDENGKFNPQLKKECTPAIIDGDTVIIAIGQEVDPSGCSQLHWTPGRTLNVDPLTLETNIPGVFAGGDIVRGPASIIEAVADGNEAAISIDLFLRDEDTRKDRARHDVEIAKKPEREVEKKPRQETKVLDPVTRKNSWDEIEHCLVAEQAVAEAKRCMQCGVCSSCYLCIEACKAQAIDHFMSENIFDVSVGAIILSCGFDEYDAAKKIEFGYGRYPNVVTSIEFERILSASGPYQGHILRRGDRKEPKRVAFIQCVGSRDPQMGQNYCSSVCCTYAIKEAIIAKEHSTNGLETTIFFMDIRTFGKGFDAYYERAKNEYGVRFVRAGVSKIEEEVNTKNLIVHYENEDGEIKEEIFDMVVLSVGLVPKGDVVQLARRLRVGLDEYHFCKTSEFMPVDTTHDGIYVCGVFSGPKDIPETVTQASGAAAKAMGLLASARNSLTSRKEYPEELDVWNQEPRIGVFVCHCGINIGGYVDVPEVVGYVNALPNVVYAENNVYTCSQDTQKRIVEKISEHKLNRVVVASCTPRTHEPLFRETMREAGLNPYLFEMANIRDQCSWIHKEEHKEATAKAKDLVKMAVAKAALLVSLKRTEIEVVQKALVIGGGITGMSASLSLAEQGFEVFLIEKEKELGGNLGHIYHTIEGRNVQNFLKRTIEDVRSNRLIKIYTSAHIDSISGFIGNYETHVSHSDGSKEVLKHGVVIVATGAKEYQPTEYLYSHNRKVVTQRELEEMIASVGSKKQEVGIEKYNVNLSSAVSSCAYGRPLTDMKEREAADIGNLSSVVMIQCVGSRDDDHPYCSRICCSQAVKNALELLALNPEVNVYIMYRDVRTYGFNEDFYKKAREAGVVFIRYDNDSRPTLEESNGKIKVSVFEPILKEKIEINADLLVLASGIEPRKDNEILAKMLKVPLNNEGFFLEAHVKLRPVDFATEGVFVAGMAHSPKDIGESISQAEAAAARAAIIIANDKYVTEAAVAHVNEELCAGCGVCSALCSYEAIEIVVENGARKSKVNEALCKGCGTCASACPAGAMDQYGFARQQIMAMIEALE